MVKNRKGRAAYGLETTHERGGKKKRERLDRWRGQTEQFARESEKKRSKDQWRNRLTPRGRWGGVRFSERRTCTPAVRPECPHPPAVPVPKRLLTLKSLYCLRNIHYAYRQRERKATVNYERKKWQSSRHTESDR